MHKNEAIKTPSDLSDDELVTEVQRLARLTRGTTAALVAHLAELEGRRLHLGAGCPSLFVYCTDVLRLSEHEAYHRIEAARLVRRVPLVLEKLADGALTLTTARLLSSHLTAENHDTLLAAAAGKSKREVAVLLATLFPLPDVPSSIRRVPAPRPVHIGAARDDAPKPVLVAAPVAAAVPVDAVDVPVGSVAAPAVGAVEASPVPAGSLPAGRPPALVTPPPPAARSREVIRPLASDRYEIRFTARATTREKLQVASDLLRHAVPDGNVAEIVDRALTALLEDLARKKFAATARPESRERRQKSPITHTRHVPARVKRAVWLRDGGRCAFVAKRGGEGRRCRERGFLEFHHVHPYAEGGEATEGNLELRCRAHNGHEAELFYGSRFPPARHAQLGPDRVC